LKQGARVNIALGAPAGMLVVDVTGALVADDAVNMQVSSGDASRVLFRVAGAELTLKQGGVYLGTFLAPAANVTVQQGARLTGMIYGNKMTIQQAAQITRLPAIEPIRSLLTAGNLNR
jgi:choice-of-anchor A domain-containing protein